MGTYNIGEIIQQVYNQPKIYLPPQCYSSLVVRYNFLFILCIIGLNCLILLYTNIAVSSTCQLYFDIRLTLVKL